MAARVVWDGLEEYRELLRHLPESLANETANFVQAAANSSAFQIRGKYPVRTGKLRDRVSVAKLKKGKYGTGMVVKNTAPHAKLFEYGTQARHTAIGANRGSMPPGNVFVPVILKERRSLYEKVKDLLRRKGALVTGEP